MHLACIRPVGRATPANRRFRARQAGRRASPFLLWWKRKERFSFLPNMRILLPRTAFPFPSASHWPARQIRRLHFSPPDAGVWGHTAPETKIVGGIPFDQRHPGSTRDSVPALCGARRLREEDAAATMAKKYACQVCGRRRDSRECHRHPWAGRAVPSPAGRAHRSDQPCGYGGRHTGFLHVAPCGGVDPRVLPGSRVVIYGREPIVGIVCCTPPHLSAGKGRQVPALEAVRIDTGLSPDAANARIAPGDRVILSADCHRLLGARATGPALDNRAGCAALLRCLHLLSGEKLALRLTVLLSSREETGRQGRVDRGLCRRARRLCRSRCELRGTARRPSVLYRRPRRRADGGPLRRAG